MLKAPAYLLLGSLLAIAACSDEISNDTTGSAGPGGATGTGSSASGGSGAGSGGSGSGGSGVGGATMGAGGAGGATGAGGMNGATPACMQCFGAVFANGTACNAAIQACDADPDCDAWKNCGEACFASDDTPACYDACDVAHPHNTALGDPLIACVCDDCAAECTGTCS